MPPGSRSHWRTRLVTRWSISAAGMRSAMELLRCSWVISGRETLVVVAPALLDRVARRHPVALGVEQDPREQARLVRAGAGGALDSIAGEPHLSRIPQQLINDWRMFARMGLSLVNDLAAIGAVPQHQVERPAREWLAADHPTRDARPRLAFASLSFELFLQQPHRAEFGIAAKDRAHEFGLAIDDDQLAVLHSIHERRHPTHPHPLPF